LESTLSNQSKTVRERMDVQLNEKNEEIESLKHALNAIESQYKAKRRELADKDDFILRFMINKTGEEAETIKLLMDKYTYLSKQTFETTQSSEEGK
jgi:septal ring factor EnvC (AmiA/AmiB activator)